MTPEEAMALKSAAYQLIALATGEAAPEVPVPLPTPAYPRVEVFAGAQFYLKAPIAAGWEPSQYGRMFGARQVLPDPSNAEGEQPLRSPAGYPLVYLIPGKPARVLYGESTFSDDAQVERYRVAVAESMSGQLKRDEEQGNDFRLPGERRNDPPASEPEVEIKVEQG
jgi:hypothetical protein